METIPLDIETERGLGLATRGDWHAAEEAFAAALAAAERGGDEVALAVALTNLGHARAYLGALTEAAELLARSAAVRRSLAARGEVGAAVAARGYTDLAAVQAAAGVAARDALLQARDLAGDDTIWRRQIEDGLALLAPGHAPAVDAGDAWLDFETIG